MFQIDSELILKSGNRIKHFAPIPEQTEEQAVSFVFSVREFFRDVVSKSRNSEPMTSGYVRFGSWQVDAMDVVAASMRLYKDGEEIEVPMP